MVGFSADTRQRVTIALAGASLFIAVFAIGSVHRWAIVLVGVLTLVGFIPQLWASRRFAKRPPLLVFLGVLSVLTMLQLLPLPLQLVELLSPGKHELIVANAATLGLPAPSTTSLSLDPASTLLELAKLAAYFLFAVSCLRIAASKRRTLLAEAVGLVGLVVALTAVGHRLAGATKLYGFYQPEFTGQQFLAPLLNMNHLASLLALASATSLGLTISNNSRRRAFWFFSFLICTGVTLLSQSRGGVIGLGAGLTLTAILCTRRVQHGMPQKVEERSMQLAKIVAIVCLLVLLLVLSGGRVLGELASTSIDELGQPQSKYVLWRDSLHLIANYPMTGIGRGAFEVAITKVHPSSHSYLALENEYLQAIVDWGVLGAGLAAFTLVMLVTTASRRWRVSAVHVGLLGGLLAIAIHSIVDFGLALPGLVLPMIACTSFLTPPSLKRLSAYSQRLRVGGVVSGLLLIGVVASPAGLQARQELKLEAKGLSQQLKTWKRHPANALAAARLAHGLFAIGDVRAFAVLNQALSLSPTAWGLHLLSARMLASSQVPDQALLEYGLCAQYVPREQLEGLILEILDTYPEAEQSSRALPSSPRRLGPIAALLASNKRRDITLSYTKRLQVLFPDDSSVLETLSREARLQGEPLLALEVASHNHRLRHTPASSLLLGTAEIQAGWLSQATTTLRRALASTPKPSMLNQANLRRELSRALLLQGFPDDALLILKEALVAGLPPHVEATLRDSLAKVHDSLGNHNQAKIERSRASSLRIP